MNVEFHRSFDKLYIKLPAKLKIRLSERLKIFMANPLDPTLRNHALSGEWVGYRSINITGDYRAIYEETGKNGARFVAVGTHGKLYR